MSKYSADECEQTLRNKISAPQPELIREIEFTQHYEALIASSRVKK